MRAFVDARALNLAQWQASAVPTTIVSTYQSAPGALLSLLWPRRLLALARAVREMRADVVVVPFLQLWTLPLMWRIPAPFVVFVHDPEPHPGLVGRVWHAIERRVVGGSRQVVIHTERFRRLLAERYGAADDRVTVVPIGPLVDYVAAPSLASARRPVVLCFGRMEPYKGIDVLLAAVPALRAAVPDVVVRCVGRGLDHATLALAGERGVEVVDRWVDEADVPGYFAAAAVVVLPYTSATQSGVIPIAAAFGCPVVATDVGGLPEQLADGRCGVVVPSGNAEALAAAVVGVLTDPSRAAALGAALRHEYTVNRSWERIATVVGDACRRAVAAPAEP